MPNEPIQVVPPPAPRRRELRDYTNVTPVRRTHVDIPFLLLTLLLLAIGVMMVLSASFARAYSTMGNATYYFVRQLLFGLGGVVLMWLISRIPVSFFRTMSWPALLGSIALLALVLVIGSDNDEDGVRRWIYIGSITFQPSEVAKLGLVMFFAMLIAKYGDKMKDFVHGVLPFGVVLGIIAFLLYKEPHLSATVIMLTVGAVMMFVGGTRIWYFLAGFVVVFFAGKYLIEHMAYAANRIAVWKDPFGSGDAGWQIVQSLYAIGSGGFLGLGLGQSRQKYSYLPAEHNDYIFAVVCEELGLVGALLILLLFALLIIRGYQLAMHARDRYSSMLITGIVTQLAVQVFLNVAVVTNFIPCTGISLPFFSYGGTALLMQMAEMGIILSVSREIPVIKPGTGTLTLQ